MMCKKKISKTILLITLGITLLIAIKAIYNDFNASAFAFILWVISPYAFLAMLIKLVSNKLSIMFVLVISAVSCVYGLWALIDAVFVRQVSQIILFQLASPFLQWAGLIIIAVPLIMLNKIRK